MDNKIPKEVSEAAAKNGLGLMQYVGIANGKQVYGEVPEVDKNGFPIPTGLPTLILWDGETAKIIGGEDSLLILSSFD